MHLFRIMIIIIFTLFMQIWNAEWCSAQNTSKIDWLQGYVSATGRGYAKKTSSPMDTEQAIMAAKILAQRELLEAIKGVKIDYQKAVSDLIDESKETSARVQGVLHNSEQVSAPQIKEEGDYVIAIVEMRVCLFENNHECKLEQSLAGVLPKSAIPAVKENKSCALFPNIISTKAILSKITYDTNQPLNIIIVNIKGFPFNTALRDYVIGFKTNNGKNCSVYVPEKVDPIIRKDRGTAEIFIHESDAKRKYGPNLVTINAKSIDNNNYIIIDEKDAYLMNLLNERENQLLFKQARIGVAAQD